MRQQNEGQRITILNHGYDRFTTQDITTLLAHLQRAPTILHNQFSPLLLQLKKDYPEHPKLREYLEKHPPAPRTKLINQHQHLVHNFTAIMQRKAVTEHFDVLCEQAEKEAKEGPSQSEEVIPPQQMQFERIQMLYPDYDSYFKMSRQEKSHLVQYHPKPKLKDFFTQPRFVVRIEEFQHFRSQDQRKGDIMYLQYQGNTISIGKVQLVANKKALQMWCWEDDNYPLPVLTIPNEDDEKKDDKKEEKKEQNTQPSSNQLQFVHKFVGHSEKITCIAVSQDQYYAITGSADRTVRMWCLRLKICVALFKGHTKAVLDVCFSPSGYYFMSAGSDGMALLWKTDEPHAQRIFYHQSPIYRTQFAKDPSFVITAGEDACLKFWSNSEGILLKTIRLNEPVINFNLGFSGAYLVAVQADGRITVLDLMKGCTVNSFYFSQPQSRRRNQEEEGGRPQVLLFHEACLSEDQRELSCVSGRFVLIYSMEKLQKKTTSNIFTLYSTEQQADKMVIIDPKEVLYLGAESNLTHCCYQSKNVLMVAGNYKQG